LVNECGGFILLEMAEKKSGPTVPDHDDSYSEEEVDRRRNATVRAMIEMKPQLHRAASTAKKRRQNRTQPSKR
jgi:hypothetical protein